MNKNSTHELGRERLPESENRSIIYLKKISDLIDYNYQPVDLRNGETITKNV